MKCSELLLRLKGNLEKYESKFTQVVASFDGDNESVEHVMSKYNHDNYFEIMNSSIVGLDDEVSEVELRDLMDRIDNYFSLYASDDVEFREFIKYISIYLTFIAKKPLHPPGIHFSNGTTVYKKDNNYYCTGKRLFIKDEQSLCKYCIARYE